ncbi:MAG TPA: phage tail tube protein [Sphingobium sp.]
MANPNRVVGQCKVKVDSQQYETDGTTTMEIGGPAREGVKGDYQAGAFKESTEMSKVELNLLYKGRLSLAAIRKIDNATLTVETDTGNVWIVRNAYVAEIISFDGGSGKAKVVFQGPPAEEMTL